ncbi:MAG: diaminopimelate decarboxylase, partial [Clostridia bacterium]|nr:diaminopimelate decarboxylase [Clostridia bacterium]
SQIFESKPFCDAASVMMRFMAKMANRFGVPFPILNLGGGFGVKYVEDDPVLDFKSVIRAIAVHIRTLSDTLSVPMPRVFMEPGRSIVADAGMTLYTVGTVKTITGYKNYVSVDGGMPDNPRYALYGSKYTFYVANRAADEADFECTVAGRCCESGDLLGENVHLPRPVRGDTLAVAVTGAYNYAMASNYNRLPRPALVRLFDGENEVAVRRETYEDLIRLDQ